MDQGFNGGRPPPLNTDQGPPHLHRGYHNTGFTYDEPAQQDLKAQTLLKEEEFCKPAPRFGDGLPMSQYPSHSVAANQPTQWAHQTTGQVLNPTPPPPPVMLPPPGAHFPASYRPAGGDSLGSLHQLGHQGSVTQQEQALSAQSGRESTRKHKRWDSHEPVPPRNPQFARAYGENDVPLRPPSDQLWSHGGKRQKGEESGVPAAGSAAALAVAVQQRQVGRTLHAEILEFVQAVSGETQRFSTTVIITNHISALRS